MRNNSDVRRQMFEMIEQWQQSGLSQKSFCQNGGIKFYTFYYWYKRYRLSHKNPESKSGFVKLKIEKPEACTSVEIHFPGDVRLFFHEPISPEYLKRLIR